MYDTHFGFHFADMRRDVQEIFRNTPHEKQVMMFSATLSKEIRPVCKKFMQDVITPSFSSSYSSQSSSYWPFRSNGVRSAAHCRRHLSIIRRLWSKLQHHYHVS
jgi:hypothetical protein